MAAVASRTISEGVETTITFTATDVDNLLSELTWSANNNPTGSVFTDLANGTATLVWTPDYTQAGLYEDIEITVSDGVGSSRTMVIKTGRNSSK
jgi:hypothetical protein